MSCVHCDHEMVWTRVANMDLVCGPCFNHGYCGLCLEPISTVGETHPHNLAFACVSCINNTPPIEYGDIEDHEPHIPFGAYHIEITNDDLYDEPPEIYENTYTNLTNITDDEINYNLNIINDEMNDDEIIYEPAPNHLYAPPAGFDMNMASVIEENQDFIDNLNNSQVEYDGNWYFAFNGQIYSVPYEIEIDDEHVREDIVTNWDDVRWTGSIFGQYIAWV